MYNMLKIIGGKAARKGEWPWQVAIFNRYKVRYKFFYLKTVNNNFYDKCFESFLNSVKRKTLKTFFNGFLKRKIRL